MFTFIVDTLKYTMIDASTVSVSKIDNTIVTANIPATVSNGTTIYNVTSIGDNAFKECTSLEKITIPQGVTSIGDNAFQSCSSLVTITIPNTVTSIGQFAFKWGSLETITIPQGVTSIGQSAFYESRSLTSVTFDPSSNLTSIGDNTFESCTSLTSITIPNTVTSIGGSTFMYCSSLTLITIPPGVTSIGGHAFYGCISLASITIPASVTSIGQYAFNDCNSLTSVYFLGNIPDINNINFGMVYDYSDYGNFNNLTNVGPEDTAYYYLGSENIPRLTPFFTTVSVMTTTTITGIDDTISKIYGSNFKLDPSSNSSGLFTYTSSDLNVATIDASGNVILVSVGTCSITINQQLYGSSGPATKIVTLNVTAPISNICFPAKTPIVTNQGIIHIDKINPEIHTIRNKKIVAITKTVSQDKYLICFEKDALGTNMPSQKTLITKNHEILYNGKMTKAKDFLQNFKNVRKVKYTGEVLYNVLMETHNKMVVNNLICETLHPENTIAKIQMVLQNLNSDEQQKLIEEYNNYVIKNNVFNSNKITK